MKVLEETHTKVIGCWIKIVDFNIIEHEIVHNDLNNVDFTLMKRAFWKYFFFIQNYIHNLTSVLTRPSQRNAESLRMRLNPFCSFIFWKYIFLFLKTISYPIFYPLTISNSLHSLVYSLMLYQKHKVPLFSKGQRAFSFKLMPSPPYIQM